MSRARIRVLLAAALVAMNFVILVGPLHASGDTVTGTLVMKTKQALTPDAVAVISLTDRSKDATAGTIIGQQRIDGATGNDAFSVQFDPAAINSKHAYSIYASVVDEGKEWQSLLPIPVITGGPTQDLTVVLEQAEPQTPAQITGTIALPTGVTASDQAVAYAGILDATTGRLVARQVLPSPVFPAAFTVAFDAALINPENSYVAAAGVIDGAVLYQTKSTTPIAPGATFDLAVVKTDTVIPVPGGSPLPSASVLPSESASASVTPSELPSGSPPVTPKPSKTPKPTGTATAEPSPTPTEAPTAPPTPTEAPTAPPTPTEAPTAPPTPTEAPTAPPTPTEAPSAPPTEVPSASVEPSASVLPSESPLPSPITITGQATYKEPATLSDSAVLTVVVVQVDSTGSSVVVVGKQEIKRTGQQPISFSFELDPALLVPTNDAFLYATLIDGVNAWTTDGGVKVATNGAPTENVQVPLTFRPDLIEGQVTGAITSLPSDIGLDAWAMAFVLDKSDGTVLGVQTGPIIGSTFIPFSVPFLIENLDTTKTYVAGATVFDDTRTFRSEQGTEVISNGVFSGVALPMILAGPSPAPSAAASAAASPSAAAPASAHPVATASPTSSSGSGSGGIDPLVLAGVAGLAIIGLIVVAVVLRR